MRNGLLSITAAAFLSLGISSAAFAGEYTDSNQISTFAEDHVEILTELGVIVGYPDGTFRPREDVTREEMAVMLLEAMVVLEERISDAFYANDIYLYEEIVGQQTQLLLALTEIDEIKAREALVKNNFVALSVIYNPENEFVDDDAYISLDGRLEVLSLTDSFTVAVRPFVNTTGEAGGALTVDYEVTEKLTVGAGAGAAGSWSDFSALAGDEEVVGYAQANVDYSVGRDGVITLGAKVPFTGDNSGDINVGLGFGVKF